MAENNIIGRVFYEGCDLRKKSILYLNGKLSFDEIPPFPQVMYRCVNSFHPDATEINTRNLIKALKHKMNIEFLEKWKIYMENFAIL